LKEPDYLVLGGGAMGMAFADVLLSETDATVMMVDRRGRPGGHWNDAYPFVRLHQPSRFYGVPSRPLGSGARDATGWNSGLFELASGAEVLAYFDAVLQQHFLPTGRFEFLPMTEHSAGGGLRSLVTGEERVVRARKIVDATWMNVNVPAMRPPAYSVDDGARVVPPNALAGLSGAPAEFVVIGAGKTAMDAVLWLLGRGLDPARLRWVMPRDSWMLDRAQVQPGADFFESSIGRVVDNLEAVIEAGSVPDLFASLEARGTLLRLDPGVEPTMYRCATVSRAELEQLRRVKNVVRMGRVKRVGCDRIDLEGGSLDTSPGTLHVDCTADGLERRPTRPVFEGARITLQSVRTCQQVFSAAFLAHLEASGRSDDEKNALAVPVPHPDSHHDWLRNELADLLAGERWNSDPGILQWLAGCRLDLNAAFADGVEPPVLMEAVGRILPLVPVAIDKLERLLATIP
jgi:hypothetical protein